MTPLQTDLKTHIVCMCRKYTHKEELKQTCALFISDLGKYQSVRRHNNINLPTHTVWLHGNGVGDVREEADGVSSVLKKDKSVSLEVKAVYVQL